MTDSTGEGWDRQSEWGIEAKLLVPLAAPLRPRSAPVSGDYPPHLRLRTPSGWCAGEPSLVSGCRWGWSPNPQQLCGIELIINDLGRVSLCVGKPTLSQALKWKGLGSLLSPQQRLSTHLCCSCCITFKMVNQRRFNQLVRKRDQTWKWVKNYWKCILIPTNRCDEMSWNMSNKLVARCWNY